MTTTKIGLIKASGKFLVPDSLADTTIREYDYKSNGPDTINSTCGQTFIFAYVWPLQVREELLEILTERKRLKKQFDDSMSLIYQLTNAIARGEKG